MKPIIASLTLIVFVNVASAQKGDFHLDKDYKMKNTGTIDLGSSDAKVFITGSSRSTAHVKIDRTVTTKGLSNDPGDFSVEVEETDGNLKIRERQSGTNVVFGYYKEQYRIEIEAPEGVSLQIRGDDGDYFIKNINGAISMSIDDGDAELTDCKGDSFRFRLDDGDLRMNQGKGKLDIDADDADVEIYNAKFTGIEADVDDGDLIIETSLTDFSIYNLNGQDAYIALTITEGGGEFSVKHDDGSVMMVGDFKKAVETKDETRATLGNGRAKVNVRADDARVKLASR